MARVNAPSFSARLGPWSGVHRLGEETPSFNGASAGNPIYRYKFVDGTAIALPMWGFGENCVVAGTTAFVTGGASLYAGPQDGMVTFAGIGAVGDAIKHYETTSNSVGEPGTKDAYFEWFFKTPSTAPTTAAFIDYLTNAANNSGYSLRLAATLALAFYVNGSAGPVSTGVLPVNAYCFVTLAWNRDEASTSGARFCLNNAYAAVGADLSAVAGSITGIDAPHRFGAGTNAGGYGFNGGMLYAAAWAVQDLFRAGANGQADHLITHQRRFALLNGARPFAAWSGDVQPVAAGSTDVSYQERLVASKRRLFKAAVGGPRLSQLFDSTGQAFYGAQVEPVGENQQTHSEDLSLWTATRASAPTTAVVCPDQKTSTTVVIKEDATASATHYLSTMSRMLTNGVVYTWSFFGKAINRSWLGVVLTGPGITRYFDLTNGVVGVTTAGVAAAWVETPDYDGWFRCGLIWTAASATTKPNLYVASADGTTTFDGANQDSLAVWGIQLEPNSYALSYIKTP